MKIVLVNGSPRKNWNTAKVLMKVGEGAESEGVETKLINLFDYTFQGCKSCFACKIKNSKTNGLCATKDELRPVLQEVLSADGFVIGAPIYFGMPTGQMRSFFERLAFPNLLYKVDENGAPEKFLDHTIPTAFVCTMGLTQDQAKQMGYKSVLESTGQSLQAIFGDNENLFVYDTYQFADYKRYDVSAIIFERKIEVQEKQFPQDLQRAFELGRRLAKKLQR